ncbi:MAG: hypothetical protein WBQ65_23830 [Bryobacteraceae bacterium]
MVRFVTGSTFKKFAPFAVALLITAGAQAATVSSTFALTGSLTVSSTYAITGQATMSGVYAGNGAFSGTVSLTGSTPTSPNYTITVSAGNTLTGIFTFASAALSTPSPGTLTITGGTGSYAGYTTSTAFSLTETGSVSTTTGAITVNFSGSGTVNTAGGGTTTPVPTIASVTDGASYTANVAPGAFFIVWGTNLFPGSAGVYPPFPWPTVSNGVKVTFTPVAGGAGTDAYLEYLGAGQINAVLPSTVAAGNYNVTVTNGTVSAPFVAQVVASKPALFTQDWSGTGLAVVQNYVSASETDWDRLTTGVYSGSQSSPAKPGQVLIAWGTGLGAWAAADNADGVFHDFSTSESIAAIVGGVSIPVAYAGRAGWAGEDQINFTLPGNIPTGCAVTLQISVKGVLSAPVSISIAPSTSATACVQPGYTTQQLQSLDQGGTITSGGFTLDHGVTTAPSATIDSIAGVFSQTSGYQLSSSGTQNAIVATSGSCVVTRVTTTTSTVTAGHSTSFDAGTVTLTGPSGTNLNNQKLTETSNTYLYMIGESGSGIPGQPSGSILAGTYTLTGAGGTDVGPFSTSITIGPPLTLNNPLPATVTESAGLTLNWTGGNAADVVEIAGDSATTSGTGANETTTATGFVCTTTAGQKTFTVPASILTWLPTISAAQVAAGTASGSLDVLSIATPATSFNATLKKDGSTIPSSFASITGISGSALYQ